MNKLLLIICCIALSFFSLNAQIDISQARGMSEGSTVTVEGIATNGFELGIIRYLQDETGAIPAYPGTGSADNFPDNVQRGDLVQVTGELKSFNGLLEIDPITSYTVVSSGNPLPDPLVVTPDGINEANEGMLVQVNGVTFDEAGGIFSVGNFTFSGSGQSSEIYIRTNHPLIGSAIPSATVNLVGISSEFSSQYQLLPRDANDIEIADNFYFTSTPIQSDLTNQGFTVSWSTNVAGTTAIRYGTTPAMENEIDEGGSATNHSVTLTSLDPAEFYYIQATSDNGSSTINSVTKYYSTASNSTGTMQVYFTKEVDPQFSNGSTPTGITGGALETAIIERINAATTSIDVCLYNNNRSTLVQALTNAHNSGIQVRYIADDGTANLALQNPNPPFQVLYGNAGDPLMHNKFLIIDADSEDNSWVITGSTNMTTNNLADDFNNTVFVQDQALAKAYTVEFQEMWGSEGANPGVFNVKFGANKEDNTPHLFSINGVTVESFFSPSDNTTVNIVNAIETADNELEFALLTFTNNELGNAVLTAHNDGVLVRGIIDNIGDQGAEYDYLVGNGVNVTPDNTTTQTHHKYCLIDAASPNSDPIVVTGSHNWSASAETRNDENTLIIHDEDIANIFLQEFEARWCEILTGASCLTSTNSVNGIDGFEANLYPNPAVDRSTIQMELENKADLTIGLWDFNGRMLQSTILRKVQGEITETLYLDGFPAGTYLVTFKVGQQTAVRKLEIVK